jgi:hypothetical protein
MTRATARRAKETRAAGFDWSPAAVKNRMNASAESIRA